MSSVFGVPDELGVIAKTPDERGKHRGAGRLLSQTLLLLRISVANI
jgi:hypothetical protein